MYLAEAEETVLERSDARPAPAPLPSDRWQNFPHSRLSHHGAPCCEIARQWVLAMDFAQLNGADLASGPRWLRQKYEWGPSAWPMHWCEAVKRDAIDCGAHAAIAHEVFAARGRVSFPAQLVQLYSEDATRQWRSKWSSEDVSCHWLDGAHIYHEATALVIDEDQIKIWDSSSGSWINPRQTDGYGAVVAVRIVAPAARREYRWGEHRLQPNAWSQIGDAAA